MKCPDMRNGSRPAINTYTSDAGFYFMELSKNFQLEGCMQYDTVAQKQF
jgi:hypothetical protein